MPFCGILALQFHVTHGWCMFSPELCVHIQDFLVRGIMGFDQSSGAMAVGGGLRLGQRLRRAPKLA